MSLDQLLHRKPPSRWDRFFSSPLTFIANALSDSFQYPGEILDGHSVRVVCLSDTHNGHDRITLVPGGDLLIHAGDLTESGKVEELTSALDWLSRQPHAHKIFIAGNHERCLGEDPTCRQMIETAYPNLTYLQDSSVTLTVRNRQLKVYGSPQTPAHGNFVFQYPRIRSPAQLQDAQNPWNAIPSDTDILVTHGPPFAHLDVTYGCRALLDALWRVKPKLHVFGHIHAGRGSKRVRWRWDQMAFEQVIEARGLVGWMMLPFVALGVLQRLWARLIGTWDRRNATVLVNASSTGGYWDKARRGALVVDI